MTKRKRKNHSTAPAAPEQPAIVVAQVDYRETAYGTWNASLWFEDDPTDVVPFNGPGAHETMHDVLDFLSYYTDQTGIEVATRHSLNGDETAWAMLAAAEGFVTCVTGGNTIGGLFAT